MKQTLLPTGVTPWTEIQADHNKFWIWLPEEETPTHNELSRVSHYTPKLRHRQADIS